MNNVVSGCQSKQRWVYRVAKIASPWPRSHDANTKARMMAQFHRLASEGHQINVCSRFGQCNCERTGITFTAATHLGQARYSEVGDCRRHNCNSHLRATSDRPNAGVSIRPASSVRPHPSPFCTSSHMSVPGEHRWKYRCRSLGEKEGSSNERPARFIQRDGPEAMSGHARTKCSRRSTSRGAAPEDSSIDPPLPKARPWSPARSRRPARRWVKYPVRRQRGPSRSARSRFVALIFGGVAGGANRPQESSGEMCAPMRRSWSEAKGLLLRRGRPMDLVAPTLFRPRPWKDPAQLLEGLNAD